MSTYKDTAQRSLYISLSLVGLFVASILISQVSFNPKSANRIDQALADAPEPTDILVETTRPIGGPPEPTTIVTASPTAKSTRTATPSASPTRTPTPTPLIEATLPPALTATPVPTFQVNFPGQVESNTNSPTPAPVARKTNTMPLIIGVVAGTLLLIGGILLFIFRRHNEENEPFQTPQGSVPPQTPPYNPYSPDNQSTQNPQQSYSNNQQQSGYTTPYDQYMNQNDQNKQG